MTRVSRGAPSADGGPWDRGAFRRRPDGLRGLREMRGGWRHFVGFFACVAVGVAALASVGTLAANVDRALTREARTLMGGDLELRAMRPLGDEATQAVERVACGGAAVTRVRELVGMVRDPRAGGSLLVELKAVEPDYPLYGRVRPSPNAPSAELLADGGALVHETLLARLGVRVGDRILVGNGTVTIRGVVRRSPTARWASGWDRAS